MKRQRAMSPFALRGLGGAIAALLLAMWALAASAAESPWIGATDSSVRLLGGQLEVEGKGRLVAGLELRMDRGWKTYWRNPGDSGVPPSFDFAGSKNLKQAQVLYPAPHRFADAAGTAIGYDGEVVFPVLLEPERADVPVELHVKASYGLCKDLCIPNEATLRLTLQPNTSAGTEQLLLTHYLDLVPKGAAAGELPAITNLKAELDGPSPKLVIEAEFPAGAQGADLFIEAGESYVPVPKLEGPLDNGKQRFVVAFSSPEEAAKIKGQTLHFSLVTDKGGREASWTVQ
jgi:DsbC/DsbD-like thiol-disulfide interchange protein